MDLEYDVPAEWLGEFRRQFPQIEIIGSWHNFHETPEDLEGLWRSLQNPQFDILKIATFAREYLRYAAITYFFKIHQPRASRDPDCDGRRWANQPNFGACRWKLFYLRLCG